MKDKKVITKRFCCLAQRQGRAVNYLGSGLEPWGYSRENVVSCLLTVNLDRRLVQKDSHILCETQNDIQILVRQENLVSMLDLKGIKGFLFKDQTAQETNCSPFNDKLREIYSILQESFKEQEQLKKIIKE